MIAPRPPSPRRPESWPARPFFPCRGLLAGLLAVLLSAASPLSAQEEARPVLSGQVLRSGSPLDRGTVVLHRVTRDEAGEVDSTAVGADGQFSLVLPTVPDPGGRSEVYFASIRHDGIFYFGSAITRAVQLDSLYVIEVHDTIHAPREGAPLAVAHRTVFLEEGEGGWQVTDLFEVVNERGRTLVAEEGGIVWSHPLPEAASGFQVGQGDLDPEAVEFTGGGVRISAPVPPGHRMFVVRYQVPDPWMRIPVEARTEAFELMVREPAPAFDVEGLSAGEAIELEPGSTYRTYSGTGLPAGTDVVVEEGAGRSWTLGEMPARWWAVILALILGIAGLVAVLGLPGDRRAGEGRKKSAPTAPATPGAAPGGASVGSPRPGGSEDAEGERRRLLLEIAGLDESHEKQEDPDPEAEERYRRRRAALLERLRALE